MNGLEYMDNFQKVIAIHEVNKLHEELASLYRVRSRDHKRIEMLWRAIETREQVLRAERVPGPWL